MTSRNKTINTCLSKSLFIRGLKCHKSLYLYKYHPELAGEFDSSLEAVIQHGYEVGDYAKKLFPGGIEIPYDGLSHSEQLELTMSEIKKGPTILYEPAFSHNDVFVKVDILRKGKTGWEIYEVKSATDIRDFYLEDLAVQYHVLAGTGLPISKAYIVHINKEYVRNGEIEVKKLFTMQNLTKDVKKMQGSIKEEIDRQKKMLKADIPEIDIDEGCGGCDFEKHCWQHIPENSIFSIENKWIDKFEYYKRGILHFKDLPLEELSDKQKLYVKSFLENREFINTDGVKDFMNSLWYPLCFLDFETFSVPIPPFDGTRPYQKIPFQYSLHYLEKESAELKHYEFLASPGEDQREKLAKKLLSEIPDDACVLAHHKSFETEILNNLTGWFPEYSNRIANIIINMSDTKIPFQRNDYYHWQMYGSASLKTVLPAIVPDLSYEGMEISDGGMAMEAYSSMCEAKDPSEIEKIRKALLEYCKLDTLAMVRILEKLKKIVQ